MVPFTHVAGYIDALPDNLLDQHGFHLEIVDTDQSFLVKVMPYRVSDLSALRLNQLLTTAVVVVAEDSIAPTVKKDQLLEIALGSSNLSFFIED